MTRLMRVSMTLFAVALMAQLSWAAESVRVMVERANLRSGPSTSTRIVGKASRGTVLQVLGREGIWIHVTAPDSGAAAYIHGSLVEVVPSAAPAEPEPAEPKPEPEPMPFKPSWSVEPRQFGAHVSWADRSIGMGLGVRASTGVPLDAVPHLGLLGTFDYLFGPATEESDLDYDGHSLKLGLYPTYSRELRGAKVYVGAGLSYMRNSWSLPEADEAEDEAEEAPEAEAADEAEEADVELSGSGSTTSLGVLAGVKFKDRYFGEIRYHFGNDHHVTVSVGILFDSPW